MRNISSTEIEKTVRELCIRANICLPDTLRERIKYCAECEKNPLGKEILGDLAENFSIAEAENIPICQDTGMAIVFLEIGQDVHIEGDTPKEAVNTGVAAGYTEGYLRCSVVRDPFDRVNTNDNTPAIVYTEIVPGDRVKITVAPKGFGSENMSRQKMFLPSNSLSDVEDFVIETVKLAGSNPCPPMVVGVGVGGDFEYAAFLSKKALCRDIAKANPNPVYAEAERRLLRKINETGIGPQGFGGDTTALAVMIESFPTHIAGLPAAVNIGCHVTRHAEAII
jgi:fumarate hydratase subunit alpha